MSIPRNLGNFADNVNTNGKVEVTGINATGTPSASTALLGDGTWGTVTTSPAGSTGQVQYNNAGAFGASSALTFDGTNLAVTQVGNPTMTVKTTGAGNNPLYRLQADTNYWDALGVFSDANDTLRFRYNGTDYLTLNNTGAVGVGSSISYGTSGQVLTSQGSGSAPTWATAGGGSWTYLSTVTASNAATVNVENTFDSTYDVYALVAVNLYTSTNGVNLYCRLKVAGSYQTNSYSSANFGTTATNTTLNATNETNGAYIRLNVGGGGDTLMRADSTTPAMLILYTQNPANTSTYKMVSGSLAYTPEDGGYRYTHAQVGGRHHNTVGALTGIQFLASTGNLYGTFRLYGIKNS